MADSEKKFEDELPELVWSFGYGSNMNAENLAKSKKVQVLEHKRAIIDGYRLRFNIRSEFKYAEPAFANIQPHVGEQVHGVAFKLKRLDAIKLCTIELHYKPQMVKAKTYDGDEIQCFVFVAKEERCFADDDPHPPSLRYKKILINGAKEAMLDEDYIKKNIIDAEHYETSQETLKRRRELIDSTLLKKNLLDWEEMNQLQDKEWISVFGHIFILDFEQKKEDKIPDFIWKHIRHTDWSSVSSLWGSGVTEDFKRISEDDAENVRYAGHLFDTFLWMADNECFGILKPYYEIQTQTDWDIVQGIKSNL